MGFKHALLKAGIGCLRGIYAPIKLQKTQNQISIISRQSKNMSVDIALLSDYIRTNYPDVKLQVLVRFIEPGISGKISYAFNMITQMKAIAKSRVVVVDGYCITASVLRHKPETRIVQMWHSMAAIKKFGHQTVDRPAGHSRQVAEIMCMHRNYDYVICPSAENGRLFCEGFNCSSDRLVEMALPRIDYIRECMKKENADALRAGLPQDREILLYAPTFRKGVGLDAEGLIKAVDYDRFTLVIKPHPLYAEDLRNMIKEMNLEGSVILDDEHGTFEWLGACDRVITDYSAIAVESLVTNRPLYFYLYDLDEYERAVGINVNPKDEMPHATAVTAEELKEILEEEYDFDELEKFRNRYLTAETHDCTARLGDFIYGITEETF